MNRLRQEELQVETLGTPAFPSPLKLGTQTVPDEGHFVDDRVRIRVDIERGPGRDEECPTFEEAGPRGRLFFEPSRTTAAVVTCGGLSPGLNNVIRSLFYELHENYGVRRFIGIRNGFLGMVSAEERPPCEIDHAFVGEIHKLGGTVLGSSRGPCDPRDMVDFLQDRKVDLLFCLGGDGTQRGAETLHQEIHRRKLPIAVIGVPKTIDNDIPFVQNSFGYATALEQAADVIRGAHVEARDAVNGIGLVKLMGRYSGYIAAGATVVSQEVNFTLVPEIAFPLDGPRGFLESLEERMRKRQHAVIVVAEGAGQHLLDQPHPPVDASGNPKLKDIGTFLRDRILGYFEGRSFPISLKYLDPSYFIRSVPANAFDRFLCDQLARHAVHAGMTGKTGMIIGLQHDQFIHVPIPAVIAREKRLDVHGDMWRAVLQVTRQPRW